MSVELRVVTWNAEGMFIEGSLTRRAKPHDAIETVKRLKADIVVVPEFGMLNSLSVPIQTAIHSLGYDIVEVPYDDIPIPAHVPTDYGMAVLTKLPILSKKIHRLGTTRSSVELQLRLQNHAIRVFGIHLDDQSEVSRLSQIADLSALINNDKKIPTLVMGDYNAMIRQSNVARIARSRLAKAAASRVPHNTIRSMAVRFSEMAYGTTIDYLVSSTNVVDLDPTHQRTVSAKNNDLPWAPSVRMAKIDWIFGSPSITATHYRVLPDVGSDHRPVLAILDIPTV